MEQLSEEEIRKRLERLRNYDRLYPELREKYEEEKAQRKVLELRVEEQDGEIEVLKLQIEELRGMIFGRKKNDDDDPYLPKPKKKPKKPKKKPRSSSSYRRRVPEESEVTEESFHGIDACPDCGEPLRDLQEVVRYTEDIILPALENLKHVIKHRIETGFCPCCRKQRSPIPVAKQMCSLGENVRSRIVHCITVLGMTFEKTKTDLQDAFGIHVSDGEITAILTEQAAALLPEYHAINTRIRGSPCKHLDETSWAVQKEGEGNWAWVKTAGDSHDTIFRMGRSRGKGNAAELHDEPGQPTVTDDYGAYDQFGDDQALCWAHPKRKFQELAESGSLTPERRAHCAVFYRKFGLLLRAVKKITEQPYDPEQRQRQAERLRKRIVRLCVPDAADPKKLATLKATFRERADAYLLCVRQPAIPMTNNKAERSLRPLVIKRKLSFGSKTQKGADVMSVLLSVCLTTWWQCQASGESFYAAYHRIRGSWAS
jgi:transposase